MKVLLVNAMHGRTGAAIAALRLADALTREGVDVRLLYLEQNKHDIRVFPNARFFARHYTFSKVVERLPALLYSRRWSNIRNLEFSPALLTADSSAIANHCDADVVNLHWINHGHMSPEGIMRISAPVVWTAHDMWPFTGGCHYSGDCSGYHTSCGRCPVLGSRLPSDLSYRLHLRKERAWSKKFMTLVCPSNWLASCAAKSSLWKGRSIRVVPNPLDLSRFRPSDREAARARLNLPQKVPLVLFAANKALQSRVKGFHFLDEALVTLSARKQTGGLHLAVVGANETSRNQVKTNVPIHFLGLASEDKMIDAYTASDLLVLPSVSDNLPNVIAEALACGTPVVAFDIGGVADMVIHLKNGYLAKARDATDLANGIEVCLELTRQTPDFAEFARARAEELFEPSRVAQQYIDVYSAARDCRC